MSRCTACNSPLDNYRRKMKPVGTWSGHMQSHYTDVVEGFPEDDEETLCKICIRSISGSNSDLNERMDPYDHIERILDGDYELDDMNAAFEYVQRVYEGYDD